MRSFTLTGSRERWGANAAGRRVLLGRRIAFSDHRKLDLFASLLAARGAKAVRRPLALTRPAADDANVNRWIDQALAGRLQEMVWLTPDGVRAVVRVAARTGRDWPLISALSGVRHFAAGAGAAKALAGLGLTAAARSSDTGTLPETLRRFDLRGRRVGVQLHTLSGQADLLKFLKWMRCELAPVLPYALPTPKQDQKTARLVARLIAGEIDALAFSDVEQATRLFQIARRQDQHERLREALDHVAVVALSPRIGDELTRAHLRADIVPSRSFFLRPVVDELVKALNARTSDALVSQPA